MDLVERLRTCDENTDELALFNEAAAEIERLHAGLREMIEYHKWHGGTCPCVVCCIARRSLGDPS